MYHDTEPNPKNVSVSRGWKKEKLNPKRNPWFNLLFTLQNDSLYTIQKSQFFQQNVFRLFWDKKLQSNVVSGFWKYIKWTDALSKNAGTSTVFLREITFIIYIWTRLLQFSSVLSLECRRHYRHFLSKKRRCSLFSEPEKCCDKGIATNFRIVVAAWV